MEEHASKENTSVKYIGDEKSHYSYIFLLKAEMVRKIKSSHIDQIGRVLLSAGIKGHHNKKKNQ